MAHWSDWVHAMWSARGHWLPGDPRGFRDHDHRVHSTGDYRHPPPRHEHAGLHAFSRRIAGPRVYIPEHVRPRIADSLVEKLAAMNVPVRIIAVDGVHAHALIRVGDADAKPVVARAKQHASFHVRDQLRGSIWAGGCHAVRVESEAHWRTTVEYIAKHGSRGAHVWEPPQMAEARARSRDLDPRS